jgi:hypothetical protein
VDAALLRQAQAHAERAGVGDRLTFRQENLFETDFRDATVVLIYLLPPSICAYGLGSSPATAWQPHRYPHVRHGRLGTPPHPARTPLRRRFGAYLWRMPINKPPKHRGLKP